MMIFQDRRKRKPLSGGASSEKISAVRYAILDIDHTLICAKSHDVLSELVEDDRTFFIRTISIQELLKIVKRKHLTHFLDELDRRNYKIIIWSAGTDSYVKDIVSVLFNGRNLEYVLTGNHLGDGSYKELSTVKKYVPGFTLDNGRLIDDSIGHAYKQEKSCVIVKKFIFDGTMPIGEEDDDLLLTLADTIDKSFT